MSWKVHALQNGHILFDSWSYHLFSVSLTPLNSFFCVCVGKWDGLTYLKGLFLWIKWDRSGCLVAKQRVAIQLDWRGRHTPKWSHSPTSHFKYACSTSTCSQLFKLLHLCQLRARPAFKTQDTPFPTRLCLQCKHHHFRPPCLLRVDCGSHGSTPLFSPSD